MAVHDHIAGAVLAAQQLVVGLLHAGLAHHVARLVVGKARIVQIVLADFAHIADQVRGKSVAGIEAPLFVDRLQFRQLVAVCLDERPLVVRNVLLDGDRLVAGRGAIAAKSGAQLLQIQTQALGDERQIGIDVLVLLANQKAGGGGVVIHHQAAFAIEQLAARRPAPALCGCGFARPAAEVVGSQHLQTPQPCSQRQHHRKNAILHHRQLQSGELLSAVAPAGKHASVPQDSSYSGFPVAIHPAGFISIGQLRVCLRFLAPGGSATSQ